MITLKNVTLRRSAKVLLDGASVTINPGEKVGLVGRNGAGKSTLFALFNGTLHEDGGDFFLPPQWRMAQVAQEMPETEQSATEFVIEGDSALMAAEAEVKAAEATDDGERMAHAYMALHDAGSHDAEARAQALILGLGFKTTELNNPVNSFSGGWRMRLQLARALMCPSDLLLLDEPTNHLDLDALVWLESWLKRYEGTMVVISHDREFLDSVTNVTLHIDAGKLTRYGGNYSTFEDTRAMQLELQQNAYVKQQDKIAHLQKFITRFKAKATKAKQAQSRVKALARMEKLAPVLTAADFEFSFREPLSLPNPMLVMDAVEVGYGETAIVRGVTKSVLPGQRIGILGANGQGKSTLVKTLAGALPRLSGRVQEGKGLAIGYFAQQEMDVLRPEEGPLAHMIRLAREVSPQAREQELRDFLGRFRFVGDMVNQEVGSLSGGEKARLVLAMLVWQRPNLLLLDEPTNHLDLTTREALSMALNEYEGTVMLVSHDRALLREVCDEFWLVTGGQVEPFDGDLDDYQKWLLEQSREIARRAREEDRAAQEQARAVSQPAAAGPAAPSSRDERKAQAAARMKLAELTRPLKKRQQQAEQALEKAQAEHAALLEAMARPDLSPAERADQGRRLKELADRIETLELEWLEIGEQIEAMEAA